MTLPKGFPLTSFFTCRFFARKVSSALPKAKHETLAFPHSLSALGLPSMSYSPYVGEQPVC